MKIHLPLFRMFEGWSHDLPQLYWNVYSSEQRIKCICEEVQKLIEYSDAQTDVLNSHGIDIDRLKSEFEEFKASGFDDYYREQIERWIGDNVAKLWETFAQQVFFGLTLDGRFVAYVPDSWKDIVFDTGANYDLETYGRLILRMEVDGRNVDQTPEYRY